MPKNDECRPLSRRTFLRLSGLLLVGEAVAACGSSSAPTATATAAASASASARPTPSPTPLPSSTPTATLTHTPTPSATPTDTATPTPTHTPTVSPTPTPTPGPLQVIVLIHGPARTLVVDNVLSRFNVVHKNIRVDRGETVPDLRDYDALIFAGGEYQPDEFDDPVFDQERERILEALDAEVPILGICLGHQLLAYWLGGEVQKGRWEVGWLPIKVNQEGQADPLLAGLGEEFYGFLWHGDQITRLPEGAVLLASSERCRVQVYRLPGRLVWGVQFNPQYDPVIAEDLVRVTEWLPKYGWDVDEIVATGYREYDDLAGTIFGNFFRAVLER